MAYLNKTGLSHLDLKPDNVLMKNGVAKIIDFGIIEEGTGRKSYRSYSCRRGEKYRNRNYLSKYKKK